MVLSRQQEGGANKRKRKARDRRVAGSYHAAQEKRERLFVQQVSRRAQERADEVMRRQYSIIG